MLKFLSFFLFTQIFSIELIGIEISYGTTECIPKCIADEGERIADIHAQTTRTLRRNESERIRIFQKGFYEKHLLNLVSYHSSFVSKHILSILTISPLQMDEKDRGKQKNPFMWFFSSSETLSN